MPFKQSMPIAASIFFAGGLLATLMLKKDNNSEEDRKGSHTLLKYKFSLHLITQDYGFGISLIGRYIAVMGHYLSFLYMTGWILGSFSHRWDCTLQTTLDWLFSFSFCNVKDLTAMVSVYSLSFGCGTALILGLIASRTRNFGPLLYLSFLGRGLPLIFLGVNDY